MSVTAGAAEAAAVANAIKASGVTSYKGLAFYAKSSYQLSFTSRTELIRANKIWVPQ
jgi:hypothetical protein